MESLKSSCTPPSHVRLIFLSLPPHYNWLHLVPSQSFYSKDAPGKRPSKIYRPHPSFIATSAVVQHHFVSNTLVDFTAPAQLSRNPSPSDMDAISCSRCPGRKFKDPKALHFHKINAKGHSYCATCQSDFADSTALLEVNRLPRMVFEVTVADVLSSELACLVLFWL